MPPTLSSLSPNWSLSEGSINPCSIPWHGLPSSRPYIFPRSRCKQVERDSPVPRLRGDEWTPPPSKLSEEETTGGCEPFSASRGVC